uniref:Ig-like domain repeat protein n=2 Tax=Methanobrevibacter smithii TaxID=2173 RepID=UPI0037DDA953
MKFNKQFFLGIMLLVLLLGVSSVSANDLNEVNSSNIELDDSSMVIMEDSAQAGSDVNDPAGNPSDDVIIVNNWGELKSYCEKTDKNYVLQLKENTNFYPENGDDNSNQITVRNNVTILGNTGAYIGDVSPKASTLFYTPISTPENSGISLKLVNLTFKFISVSKLSSLDSGMVVELAGDCTGNLLENCTFDNITALSSHACVYYIKKGYTTVRNCNFTNINTCFGVLSIYDPDAGLNCNTSHMLVENSYFENNYATTEPGCINNCGQLIVKNSTFYKNSAFWWAGAIHTHSGANTTIYDSNFTDNVAGWNGGALYTYSYLQIYNTTFTSNNCTTNNGGGAIGACFYGTNPHIYIENSLFQYNTNNCWSLTNESTTGTGRGGAISIMDAGDLDVYNTTFIANSASIGTAICANQAQGYGSPNVRLIGNKFINHTVVGDVLIIDLSKSELELSDNYYYNNSLVFSKTKLSEEERIGNTTVLNIQFKLKNDKYYDSDILSKSGYFVYVDGVYLKTVYSESFNLTFNDGKEHKVYVRSVAGVSNSNNLTVNGVPVQYIYVSVNGNDNNNGSKNAPVRTIAKAISLNTNGIYILEGNYREYGLNINSDLKIVGDGKAIIGGISSADSVFKISNNANVSFNNLKFADIFNGEIINGLAAGEVEITGCEFYSNNQKGILVNVANLLISDSKFENNNVFKCIYTNYLEMRNCEFVNNTANEKKSTSEVGNLIYLDLKDQQGIILGTSFENNNVYQGCIYVKSSDFNQGLEIADSVFINNTGVFRGGCLYADSSSSSNYPITISSSVFIDNFAQSGSVAFVMKKCVLTATNSIFLGNKEKSPSLGEVFSTVGSSAKFAIDNNWWGNTAENATAAPRKGLNNWLFLNVTSNVDKLNFNENAIITVDLANVITSKGEISKYDAGDKLPLDTLNITSINGVATAVSDKFIDGKLQVIFTPTATGEASVTTNLYGVTSTLKFDVSKAFTNLNIYTNDIKVKEDLVIKVALESSRPTGTVTVKINNKDYTIDLVNGTGVITISGLTGGEYEITAKYNGDDNYEEALATSSVKVNKIASSMDIKVSLGKYTTIVVSLPEDATGEVMFTVDGESETATIEDGKAYLVLFDLDEGVHTVHAVYGGDNNYFGCEASEQFSKVKLNSTLTVNANDAKVGEDVVISVIVIPAPGSDGSSVNITIGDKSTIVKVDKDTGKASLKVSDLAAGNYTVKVVYSGNGLYNGCENTTDIKITGYPVPQWDNDGFDTKNTGKTNYTGDSNGAAIWNYVVSGSQINGSMAIDNAGNIYVACNDGIYSFTSNGTLRWKFAGSFGREISSGIAISRDIIIAPKSGDAIYFINSTTGKKYNSNIWQGSSIFSPVVDENANVYISGEYQYSSQSYNLVIIPYNMWKSGGTPTMIALGSQPVSAPTLIGNGLVAVNTKDGLKIINVTSKTVIGSFGGIGIVGRPVIDSNYNIYVFDKDGKVNALTINNKLWTTKIAINGSVLALDDENGVLYTVGSDGNVYKIDIFNKGETSVFYNFGDKASSIMIDNNGTVYIGSDNGKVSAIDSNAKLLWTFAADSSAVGPIVMDKNGTVYVYSNKTVYALGVGKVTPAINVTVEDIKVGEEAIINIELPSDATGSVEVVIGNITQSANIKNGKASVSINNLNVGQYTATIQYNGDNKYGSAKATASFNVTKLESKVDISVDNIEIGENAVVTVSVTSGATGNVTVVINGKSQVVELKDSKATVTIENLTAEDYKIEATYNGDAKYLTSSAVYTFNVNKLPSSITVSAGDIKVGEDAVIVASVIPGATGNVTFTIGDKTETVEIKDGKATLTVKGLASGDYTVSAVYNGDDKYLTSSNSTSFKVSKLESKVDISVDDIEIGKDAVVTVSVTSGATGNVTFTISDKTETVEIKDGKATLTVKDLASGNYKINAVYNGDAKYLSSSNSTSFKVSKISGYDIKVNVSEVNEGENATVTVILPKDATGNVTLVMNNRPYFAKVIDGVAKIIVPYISAGT